MNHNFEDIREEIAHEFPIDMVVGLVKMLMTVDAQEAGIRKCNMNEFFSF